MEQMVILNKALFAETGSYNDMALRPYEASLHPNIVDTLKNTTVNGSYLTPSNIGTVASDFIRPSAMVESVAGIHNGWGTKRHRFIIDLQYPSSLGGPPVRKILQGYTSEIGVTNSTHNGQPYINPNMVLYFNNVLSLRTNVINTPNGVVNNVTVSESNHLLRNSYLDQIGFDIPTSIITTLRPEDVFHSMTANQVYFGDNDIYDLRPSFAGGPLKKSRRGNTNPTRYLSSILSSYSKSTDSATLGFEEEDYGSVIGEARGMVQEDDLGSDPFFHTLSRQTQSFEEGGAITYGEMCAVMPDFDHKAVFTVNGEVHKAQQQQQMQHGFSPHMHTTGESEHWFGAGLETTWATALSNTIPSLMMDLMFTRVIVTATNTLSQAELHSCGYPQGNIAIMMPDYGGFVENFDMTNHIKVFMERLRQEVLMGLSRKSEIPFTLTAIVDVMGETSIRLAIDSSYETLFVSPSFADGLYVPLITGDMQKGKDLASNISTLAENIKTEYKDVGAANFNLNNVGRGNFNDDI